MTHELTFLELELLRDVLESHTCRLRRSAAQQYLASGNISLKEAIEAEAKRLDALDDKLAKILGDGGAVMGGEG